jgi:hypothetical protein
VNTPMQVNLSSRPVLVNGPNQVSSFRNAMTAATEYTGTHLFSVLRDDVGSRALEGCLDNLFNLAQMEGPAQAAAAAAIFSLALEGAVMLPVGGRSLRALAPVGYPFNLPALVQEVDKYVQGEGPRWLARDTHLQFLLATDCRRAGEFDLQGFAKLHSWLMSTGEIDAKFSLATAPYMTLRGVEHAEGSVLGRGLRHAYIIWRASGADKTMDFEQFVADPKNMEGARVHGHERERVELQSHIDRRQALEQKSKSNSKVDRPQTPHVQNLMRISELDGEDAPEKYFAALTGGSNVKGFRPDFWLDTPVDYPGREHLDVAKLGAKWFVAFRAFLAHRQKDYETNKQVKSSLHVLADYLLLYLPWWMAKHPDTTLKFPEAPKQFLRYYYVDRTRFHSDEAQNLGDLPKTLNELLHMRRHTPDARNTTRITLQKFFSFVLTYFEDNDQFVNKQMQNPIRTDFDNDIAGRPTTGVWGYVPIFWWPRGGRCRMEQLAAAIDEIPRLAVLAAPSATPLLQ